MTWYYLSFADASRPKGEQFLGGLVIEAANAEDAPMLAWLIGENPGGEVLIVEIEHVPPERYRGRLLGKEQLREIGGEMGDPRLRNAAGRFV